MEKYKIKLSKLDLLKSNFFGILSFIILITWWTYAANLTSSNIWTWTISTSDIVTASAFDEIRKGARNARFQLIALWWEAWMWCEMWYKVHWYTVCASNARRVADWRYDWLSQNRYNWNWWLYSRTKALTVCRNWFHLPSRTEWDAVMNDWKWIWEGWIADSLWLQLSGFRYTPGYFDAQGSYGAYWSSTEDDSSTARNQYFLSSDESANDNHKYVGFSVRCFKD